MEKKNRDTFFSGAIKNFLTFLRIMYSSVITYLSSPITTMYLLHHQFNLLISPLLEVFECRTSGGYFPLPKAKKYTYVFFRKKDKAPLHGDYKKS